MAMTVLQWLVIGWFVLSVLTVMLGRLVFALWLESQGGKVGWFWVGRPGYLESVYRDWSSARGRSARAGLIFLYGSLVSAAVATPAFVAIWLGHRP
jgi:hypothetical protein